MAEKKFLDFMDRFDGGGMGKSGDKFEGGGLLSLLGNIFATPRGSEDRAKKEALAGLLGNTRPNMRPNRPASIAPAATPALAQSPLEMFGGQQPAPYSPTMQGSGMTPANNYAPSSDPFSYSGDREAGMAGESTQPQSQADQEMAMGLGPFGYGGRPIYENVPETSGMNPSNAYPDPRQRFAEELVEMIGPDKAQNYLGTGAGEQLYTNYVNNGYKFPNY